MAAALAFAPELSFVGCISAIGTNERNAAFGLLTQAEAELLFCDWRHSGALTALQPALLLVNAEMSAIQLYPKVVHVKVQHVLVSR